MTFVGWTKANEERLEALVKSRRFTFSEIALQIGCSHNAAIGKARRMGLDDRKPRIGVVERMLDRMGIKDCKPRVAHRMPRSRRTSPLPVVAPPSAQSAPAPTSEALSREALEAQGLSAERTCQWKEGHNPADRSDFCGKPALLGKSWCSEHYKRVFTTASGKAPARLRLF